jgi:hypothetical protein
MSLQGGVELFAGRFNIALVLFPNDVDFRVVGDRFKGDVGNPLVDKAVA